VVFKNQARDEPSVKKRFINDTIRWGTAGSRFPHVPLSPSLSPGCTHGGIEVVPVLLFLSAGTTSTVGFCPSTSSRGHVQSWLALCTDCVCVCVCSVLLSGNGSGILLGASSTVVRGGVHQQHSIHSREGRGWGAPTGSCQEDEEANKEGKQDRCNLGQQPLAGQGVVLLPQLALTRLQVA
jgi:hypothetical protein